MEDCLFCKIVNKDIPSYIVWEDDNFLAFLDIFPIKPGHTLVIPKVHYPYIFEMEDQKLTDLAIAAKKVADKLKQTFTPKTGKVGMVVYGLDVDHTHLHLVPLDQTGDLDFSKKTKATQADLEAVFARLQKTPLI